MSNSPAIGNAAAVLISELAKPNDLEIPYVSIGKLREYGDLVCIVMDTALVAVIEAGPCVGIKGEPRVKEAFGEWFRTACHAARVKKTAHGLRRTAATKAGEDGWSEAELDAKYGWREAGSPPLAHARRTANAFRSRRSSALPSTNHEQAIPALLKGA